MRFLRSGLLRALSSVPFALPFRTYIIADSTPTVKDFSVKQSPFRTQFLCILYKFGIFSTLAG